MTKLLALAACLLAVGLGLCLTHPPQWPLLAPRALAASGCYHIGCNSDPLPQQSLVGANPAGSITDALGNVWTVIGGQISKNNVLDPATGGVVLLLYYGDIMYQQNSAGNWYQFTTNNWPGGGACSNGCGSLQIAGDPRLDPQAGDAITPGGTCGSNCGGGGGGTGIPLLGVEMDPPDNPVFSSYMGRYPDVTIDGSYLYIDGSGNNPCGSNYPLVIAVPHFGYQGGGGPWNDPNASANGSYNSQYDNFWQSQVGPCAGQIYAVRVDWEWDGNWYNFSPYGYTCLSCDFTERISPATWVAGFQQFVSRMRAYGPTANIKVEWDYPMSSESGAVSSDPNIMNYYPGDAYVDIVGADVYFNPQYQGSGSGSVGWNAWNSGQGLQQWAAFAAAHHKAMGVGEWCDMYYDGYNIAQFAAFMAKNPFVFHDYWDTDDGGAPCRLQEHGTNQTAYVTAFGVNSSQYPASGTFWGGLKALPSPKPPGF